MNEVDASRQEKRPLCIHAHRIPDPIPVRTQSRSNVLPGRVLGQLSIRIHDDESHQKVAQWFYVACIIHNYLLDQQEEWTNMEDVLRAHAQEGIHSEIERRRNRAARENIYRQAIDNEESNARVPVLTV